MVYFGKPTAKLRKLLRSKVTLAISVILCIVFVLTRTGYITLPGGKIISDAEFIERDGSATGSGIQSKSIETGKGLHLVTELLGKGADLSNSVESREDNSVEVGDKHPLKIEHESYLQLVNEVNPSHSLEKDRHYSTSELKILAQEMNQNQFILNKDKFPNIPRDGVVIVVQVHKRLEYLVELLASLETVRGIENVLLVISSDWYSDGIVEAVKKIQFCQVAHIFFPFAEQLHPDAYPGTDPNDCPRDIDQAEAKRKKCNNADHPDKYGHYREAKYTMTKHHWWWKANIVFDKLSATKNLNGPVVFLEEDHYACPDFYHTLVQLHQMKQSDRRCKNSCDILNLGMYVEADSYLSVGNKQVTLTRWRSYDHNMGMALDRTSWEKIKKCTKVFCSHDDYNWDWTLMQISLFCLEKPLYVLSMDLPRVFHIGECGMHHQGKCNTQQTVDTYKELISRNSASFFPKELVIGNVDEGSPHTGMQNGGWGDKRDHELCESFVKKSHR